MGRITLLRVKPLPRAGETVAMGETFATGETVATGYTFAMGETVATGGTKKNTNIPLKLLKTS